MKRFYVELDDHSGADNPTLQRIQGAKTPEEAISVAGNRQSPRLHWQHHLGRPHRRLLCCTYIAAGSPNRCFLPSCRKPFEKSCFRGGDGYYYCSETCAHEGFNADLQVVEVLPQRMVK